MLIRTFLSAAVVLIGSAACLTGVVPKPISNSWVNRSGAAEALADLASGRAVKLYTHVYGGERGGFRAPGLLYCDPDQNIGNKAAEAMFVFIPEANFSEGVIYSADEQSLQQSASAFATAYNLTIFYHRHDHVVGLCPKVELERKQDLLR